MTIETATEFGKMCRTLRMSRHLTQRRVAEQSGLAIATVGGLESSPYRVVGLARATTLADEVFRLRAAARDQFLAAWERTPLSPYGEKKREIWRVEHERRSKAANYDRIVYAGCEAAIFMIDKLGDIEVCGCDFGVPRCEFCVFVDALGVLEGWQDYDRTVEKLLDIQEAHEPKAPKKKPNRRN